jgi:hypothetical protein
MVMPFAFLSFLTMFFIAQGAVGYFAALVTSEQRARSAYLHPEFSS